MPSSSPGRLRSVNLGRVRPLHTPKREVPSAIVKEPAAGPVAVRGVNAVGDEQADRTVHGGPDQVLYAYAAEDYSWWEAEVGRSLAPGTFGENLTVEGVEVSRAVVGESWRVGSLTVQVTGPRIPCFKLAARMGDPKFVKRFLAAGRPGAYLRVLEEGVIEAEDPISVLSRPAHGVTLADVVDAYTGRIGPEVLLSAPEIAVGWKSWAAERR